MSELTVQVELSSDSLLSKWGFGDGDVLVDAMYEWEDMAGIQFVGATRKTLCSHDELERIVRACLLPKILMEHRVEVIRIRTIHNPIRITTVDGHDVDWLWTADPFEPAGEHDSGPEPIKTIAVKVSMFPDKGMWMIKEVEDVVGWSIAEAREAERMATGHA